MIMYRHNKYRVARKTDQNVLTVGIVVASILFSIAQPAFGQDNGYPPQSFERIQLSSTFYAEGVGIGDINGDDRPDVVAGPYWYEGANFKQKHAFYEPKMFDPRAYSDNFIVAVHDVNKDRWNDILVVGFPGEAAYWYENPGNSGDKYWPRHLIHPQVDNESPTFFDMTGDDRLDLVFHTGGYLGYASPNPKDPTKPWSFKRVSKQRGWGKFTHGLGLGDVNGDDRSDIVKKEGWWENPGSDHRDSLWPFHPADFGPGGAQIHVYDVNEDGRNDVITTLDAHGWGLAWFEQVPSAKGMQFRRHLIMGASLKDNPYGVRFSQPHALALVDLDRDGVKDLVSGKRFWAHGPEGGFEPNAPAVVYWFKLNRMDGREPHFIPYLVDDASGVGVEIATGDLNGDGYPDIVTSNKNGTFIFKNIPVNN